MNTSPEIKELVAALAKAQGAIEDAEKDGFNPGFKSRYATLASVRSAIRTPLSENGLIYTQDVSYSINDKYVSCETLLAHASGQFISTVLSMPVVQPNPQGIGSALSYAKRYSLMALVGLATDDDDGEGVGEDKARRKSPPAPPSDERRQSGKPLGPDFDWSEYLVDLDTRLNEAVDLGALQSAWTSRPKAPRKLTDDEVAEASGVLARHKTRVTPTERKAPPVPPSDEPPEIASARKRGRLRGAGGRDRTPPDDMSEDETKAWLEGFDQASASSQPAGA